MNPSLLLAIASGFLFGFWPLIAANAKVPASWLTLLVSMGTTSMVYLGQAKSVNTHIGSLTLPNSSLLIGLGLLNGLGIILYGKLLTAATGNTSGYIAMTFVVMTLVASVGGAFYGEPLNTNKVIGAFLAIGSVWFLNKA